jgi:hypothetical protein
MSLPTPLQQDLAQLSLLRFHRYEQCAKLVRQLHRLKRSIDLHSLAPEIRRVQEWLIQPLTLQALDFPGLARHIVDTLRAGKAFDADFVLLMKLIAEPPEDLHASKMREHEEAVAEGRYDALMREPARFREIEAAILSDAKLREAWFAVKARYKRHFRPNTRGVMKRTLARERGFESRHAFNWLVDHDRFQITFDALCHRWCLYGFENDQALTLKLTANPTPHGTMIFIPRLMSMDGSRMLVWKLINRIHRAHGARRQGTKMSSNRLQSLDEREQAKRYNTEARQGGRRGDRRYIFVLRKMGQPINRISWVKRLIYS